MTGQDDKPTQRLVRITFDESSIGRSSQDIEHERAVAIYDLLEDNSFTLVDSDAGPYVLRLGITENRLVFDIRREDSRDHLAFGKGIHYCLGASLARMQTRILFDLLSSRAPEMTLVPDQELTFPANISFRGPRRLLVDWPE